MYLYRFGFRDLLSLIFPSSSLIINISWQIWIWRDSCSISWWFFSPIHVVWLRCINVSSQIWSQRSSFSLLSIIITRYQYIFVDLNLYIFILSSFSLLSIITLSDNTRQLLVPATMKIKNTLASSAIHSRIFTNLLDRTNHNGFITSIPNCIKF